MTTETADLDAADAPKMSLEGRRGRVIILPDIAYRTYVDLSAINVSAQRYARLKALVFYLYTNEVAFAPLRSQKAKDLEDTAHGAPYCSPKSMYRIADKVCLMHTEARKAC